MTIETYSDAGLHGAAVLSKHWLALAHFGCLRCGGLGQRAFADQLGGVRCSTVERCPCTRSESRRTWRTWRERAQAQLEARRVS